MTTVHAHHLRHQPEPSAQNEAVLFRTSDSLSSSETVTFSGFARLFSALASRTRHYCKPNRCAISPTSDLHHQKAFTLNSSFLRRYGPSPVSMCLRYTGQHTDHMLNPIRIYKPQARLEFSLPPLRIGRKVFIQVLSFQRRLIQPFTHTPSPVYSPSTAIPRLMRSRFSASSPDFFDSAHHSCTDLHRLDCFICPPGTSILVDVPVSFHATIRNTSYCPELFYHQNHPQLLVQQSSSDS